MSVTSKPYGPILLLAILALVGCAPARFQGVPEQQTISDGVKFDTRVLKVGDGLFDVFVQHTGYTGDKDLLQMRIAAVQAARIRIAEQCPKDMEVVDAAKWGELEHFFVRIQCK